MPSTELRFRTPISYIQIGIASQNRMGFRKKNLPLHLFRDSNIMSDENDRESGDCGRAFTHIAILKPGGTATDGFPSITAFRGMLKARGDRISSPTNWKKTSLKPFAMVVYPSIDQCFDSEECENIIEYISTGGSVLIELHEQMEPNILSNTNYILEHFGISVSHSFKFPNSHSGEPRHCYPMRLHNIDPSKGIYCFWRNSLHIPSRLHSQRAVTSDDYPHHH